MVLGATYNSMAMAHQALGNFAEALEFYEKALGILRTAFGEEHLKVGKAQAPPAAWLAGPSPVAYG